MTKRSVDVLQTAHQYWGLAGAFFGSAIGAGIFVGIALAAWVVGDAILLLVLFPAMSRYLTPVVKRAGLLVDYLF